MSLVTAKHRILLALILLISAFAKVGFSCSCQGVPPCVSYSKSDKVFVGKLQKIDPDTTLSTYAINAKFEVHKVYKGDVAKTESITIELGSCEREPSLGGDYFSVGKTYFVYSNKNISSTRQYCDRTSLLSDAKSDLEYVNNLSDKQPIFSIFGDIYGLNDKELKDIKIQLKSDDNKSYSLIPDQSGRYEFKTSEDKLFNVEILFPPNRGIRLNEVIVNYEDDKTIVKYPAKFIRNGCSYKDFEVEK
jgi:hypothetical protein